MRVFSVGHYSASKKILIMRNIEKRLDFKEISLSLKFFSKHLFSITNKSIFLAHKFADFLLRLIFPKNEIKKTRKRVIVSQKTLKEFIFKHEAKNESHGEKYWKRYYLSVLLKKMHKAAGDALKVIGGASWRFSVSLGALLIIFSVLPSVLSAPRSISVSTRAQWEAGTQSNTNALSSSDAIQLSSVGSWNARVWSPTPEPINAGHSSVSIGNYTYITRGQADKAFWRYDNSKNKWETMPDLPQPAYLGADMTYLSSTGDIYMIFGGYSLKFYKFSTTSQTWTKLTELLDAPYSGAAIENDGTNIYFARGNSSTDFYKYDVASDQWLNRAPVTATVSTGGDLVNGQDGFLYILRGNLGAQMYRYNMASNLWENRTAITAAIAGDQRGAYANGYLYFLRSGSTNTFYRFDIAGNSWLALAGTNEFAPMATNSSSLSYNSSENRIYGFRSVGTTDFWKFNPAQGTNGEWINPKQLMDGTLGFGTGGDLIWNGQVGVSAYLYATRGASNGFNRYDVATNSWSTKANLPYSLSTDTKGVLCGGNVYFLQPGATTFYSYTEDIWTTFSTSPNILPAAAGAGSSMACTSDNAIYAIRGGGTSSFYKYVVGTGWSTLPATIIGTVTYNANIGARVVAIGTNVYAMMGNGETAFLKYNGTVWSSLKATPFSQYYGTDMTTYGGKIYAIAGYYKNEFWEYNPTSDAWRMLPENQKYLFGRGPYNGASIEYAGGTSFYATTGQGLADMWSYTGSATNFVSAGNYVSKTFDLSHVDNWLSFIATDAKPSNTAIAYETRTSSDQSSWSIWQTVSGTNIQSPVNRYIQVRINLSTTDGVSTPTVNNFQISYNAEENSPNNPTVINAFSQNGGGQTLASGSTYAYDHPYFQWSGATDAGSGVTGYYVYFGSDNQADPAVSGIYQTALNYLVNDPLEQTAQNQVNPYYLRIKTKDNNGNISSATWQAFTYVYGGASPIQSQTISTKDDFDKGTFSSSVSRKNLPTDDGSINLTGISGLWNQSRLSVLPGGVSYGAEFALGNCQGNSNHCIYTAAGNNSNVFYRYEIETDTWSTKAVIPTLAAAVYYGGSIVEGPPGYLFLAKGYVQASFLQYEIATDTWTSVDSAPKNFDYGSNLAYDGSRYIYAMPGNDDAAYRYDTCNGQAGCTRGWTTLANANFGNPNTVDGQKVYEGSDSVYDNRNNIYVLQGNLLPYFAKYSISGDASHGEIHNTWTPLAPAPEGFYDGGSLAFDEASQSIFAVGGNNAGTANTIQNFYKYDIASNTWSVLPNVPGLVSYGGSMVSYNGYLYLQRGVGTTNFYRFNISKNTWELPNNGFFGPAVPTGNGTGVNSFFPYTAGTFMVSDGVQNLFITRGGLDNTFGKYDVKTGTFNELARLPVGATTGASITYDKDDGNIYYVPGILSTTRTGFTTYFYKYSVTNNVWSEITTDRPPGQVTTGSAMTYDGSRYLYLTQGSSYVWWRYDPQGASGSRWSVMTPMTAGACVGTAGDGSKIIYKGGYIYVTRGGTTTSACRFQIGGAWAAMGALPATVAGGSGIADSGDGYLYVTRGGNTNDYYRYDTTQSLPGVWQTVSSTVDMKVPALVTTGGVQAFADNKNWIISGAGTNSYADGLYSYLIGSTGNGTGFMKNGTYTSPVLDLVSVYHWANLTVNYTKPLNTFVSFETRSSADGVSWSAWTVTLNDNVSATKHIMTISSPTATFLQIRASFSSSDQVYSPNITDMKVNYYQDTVAPNNPSSVTAYSDASRVTQILEGTWDKHPNPSFVWPEAAATGGAMDNPGGSGIAGYYVYFGNDSNADPFTLGTFQTSNVYNAANLISGKAYYLRIKAIDNANMIPAESYSGFVYQYDTISPTNPTAISVTPTGYTAIDKYDFLWTPDATDDYSGVAKFQYRTDGDVANVWNDIGDTSLFQLTIPNANHAAGAYQSGKNKFYLRTVDNAGNFSEPIVQEYYYSASAPTPPQNLVVAPQTSQVNFFSFSWDQPASFVGESGKLTYYYSINVLPTPNNVVATNLQSAGPGAFATQRGQNTFFVVAADQAGNVEFNNYASVNFFAETSAPGVPGNIQIFDTSDRENAEYSIAVKWVKPDELSLGNFDGYVIYRSEDNVNFSEIAKTTGSAYVDTKLESKLYYYYIKSKDKTNNYSIASTTVSIIPTGRFTTPPKLVGTPTSKMQAFQGEIAWVTDRAASSFVEYGKSIALGQTTGQVDSLTNHIVLVKGLDAGTKYFYRVKYIDPDGNIGTSEIDTLTTLPPPTISEVVVSDIQLSTAYVSWKTNTSATCILDYGSGSSMSIKEESGGSSHVQKIDKLMPANDYKIQISCLDSDANNFKSDEYLFSTPEEPTVSNITIDNKENVDLPTIVIAYKTNVPTTTYILFKGAQESGQHTYLISDRTLDHSAEITGLDPSIEYTLQISGVDEHSIAAKSVEQKITTRFDSRPPVIVTSRAIGKVMGRGKSAQANVYIRVETDEPTKIKIGYAKGIVTKSFEQTAADDAFNTYHLITIPAETGQVYSYQISAFDEAENVTNSEAMTIAVDQSRANATEVITSTFLNQFGWISKLGGN